MRLPVRLRDSWPTNSVEIKGSSLHEDQAAQLLELVSAYDIVVQFIAVDTNTHPEALVRKFKNDQADAVTKNLTREHPLGMVMDLYLLCEALREMPNQLFLQSFSLWLLVIKSIRDGTLYYVQREPEELADIGWVIDRKDRTLTQMENTWSTLILPMS